MIRIKPDAKTNFDDLLISIFIMFANVLALGEVASLGTAYFRLK